MAVGDESASHRGMRPPVFLVEVLYDFLAGFGIEVHVDIGRHLPLFGEEALEDQPMLDGVDRRDLEQISHHRIGGRAAPLTADAILVGEAHDIPDDQEIIRQARSFR